MKRTLKGIYYFLPVQLLLLHFRKYQMLLGFWLVLLLTLTGNFAAHFGASSLFLAPEYLGKINFMSMFLTGCAFSVFMMTWHITTFIIHSKRMPYMGATRHAFLIYSFNNFVIPLAFLVFYSVVTIRFQYRNEHAHWRNIVFLQLGFYLGFMLIILVSFAYFFRVSRDFFKAVLTKVTNPARIRRFIPYDSLDYEVDIIPARSYISGRFRIERSADLAPYHPRVLTTILRRHHRNVVFATFIAYAALLIMGIFMDEPLLRIPAGASFVLLFSIIMGFVGAFKYFLKSWETIGWVVFVVLLSTMVKYQLFDLRSIAYGLNYHLPAAQLPEYNYHGLHKLFTPQRFARDEKTEEGRLDKWKAVSDQGDSSSLVVITVSGGGSRSAYWTFRTLQYMDSLSHGRLFRHTVLITGASGGMIGATYWRSIHDAYQQGLCQDPYSRQYQENVGKDLLNSIIFSLASVDLISPFNKISIAGHAYTRDRGYALEQELVRNTDKLLDKNLAYFAPREAAGQIPMLIVNGTIVNDGRKLMMTNEPVGYLTQPEYALADQAPPIDAVDYGAFFAQNDPYQLRITSALRMNATFPFVLPVVRMPSNPAMNIMDAGLRDNFGAEVASRYLYSLRGWLQNNISNAIFLEIRDTRENDVTSPASETSLGNMLMDPLFVIQNKWEAFQSYNHSFLKEYTPLCLKARLHFITLAYVPKEAKNIAELNFHLTKDEKEDIYESIYDKDNQKAVTELLQLLH